MLRDPRFGEEPADGDNLRPIGRSLSGTVVTSRRGRLTATRSFVSALSCALLPPCGCADELHLPDVALSTRLLPVLFSPAVCLVSPFCPAVGFPPCPPALCCSFLLFHCLSLKGEAGWCQCLSLLTSSLLSPCCYSTTIISPILFITNTYSSPPPSTASQVNTALSSNNTCGL